MIVKTFCTVLISSAILFGASMGKEHWLRPADVPQPKDNKLTPERVALGKLLYFDTRLSEDGSVSCAFCHAPDRGWSDAVPTSKAVGVHGRVGPRNTPTIINSAYNYKQFWDGRAASLEEQALGPIQADVEMNMSLKKLLKKLNGIKGYTKLFAQAYPKSKGVITKEYLAKAIASFERTVLSSEAPFDRYIKGDTHAISKEAQKGFELFKGRAHCNYCHDGFNFTDGSFHNIGLQDGELHGKELGRYNVKARPAWYGAMKTPTLREITKTYPYFHDGSVKTLKEATTICAMGGRYEHNVKNKAFVMKNRNLSEEEIDAIVAFEKTLSGKDLNIKIPTKFPQ